MAHPGTTAVLAVLPEAEPLLRLAAEVAAGVVRPGVPAHAALLYPWLPADRVGAPDLDRLHAALPTGDVRIRLTEVEQEDGFVAVPVPGLRAMATAVRSAFPAQVPYGGRFGQDPPAHVTVAMGAGPATAATVARRVGARLPIVARITALHAVVLTPTGWQILAELPLSSRARRPGAGR
ncbi:2'-5' RNA ligase family protein [Streptomyces beihaiensis]|uniref:2'-5' RNA ligase family protein n=1 Tax=Streptomyces beihaiensis TaxID=2984495 RepID=A0ABT3TX75_9ACTN|nr:2'-5' RNA ligase family protein [Streptomyces beihaiensis]MCX3061657.1 2'-5' RNA ligase family protein [Streptomyces beihaiensis]